MNGNAQLESAIKSLYQAFSKYDLPAYTDPCRCCHTLEDEAKLHAAPLQLLKWDHLEKYIWDATLTWGNTSTFKHLCPRIFELFATGTEASVDLTDPEFVLNKLRYAHWRTWPADEQSAVEDFLHAVWSLALGSEDHVGRFAYMDDWLSAIAQAEDDLTPYLHQWLQDERLSAHLALSSFLLQTKIVQDEQNGRNGFWADRDGQYMQVHRWAKSPAVAEKLRRAELQWSNTDVVTEFSMARSIIS